MLGCVARPIMATPHSSTEYFMDARRPKRSTTSAAIASPGSSADVVTSTWPQ
jgi:hypothetical protein